jgi:hypothetical protein
VVLTLLGGNTANASTHDELVSSFSSSLQSTCITPSSGWKYTTNHWLEYDSKGGDNNLYIGKNASLTFSLWMGSYICGSLGGSSANIGTYKISDIRMLKHGSENVGAKVSPISVSLSGGRHTSTGFKINNSPSITVSPPAGGWTMGQYWLSYTGTASGFGTGNGVYDYSYPGAINVQDFTNSIKTAIATLKSDAGKTTVTYRYYIFRTGTYVINNLVNYYFTGSGACGSSSSPCDSIGVPYVNTGNYVYSNYTATAADVATGKICQTIHYSPVSSDNLGWGSKQVCAEADNYTNSVTSTASPDSLPVGSTVTFKHTIAKSGLYAKSTDVKYYTSGKSASGSSSAPLGTQSVAVGSSYTVNSTYKTVPADVGKNVCQTLHYSPVSNSNAGWGTSQACAQVYKPWEITTNTTASGYTVKSGKNVANGTSITFTHNIKNNGLPVVDASGKAVKIDVYVKEYIRGGTKDAAPNDSSKINNVYRQDGMTSTAANWSLMSNKQFTRNVAGLEGKTYCQYAMASKSKRGSSDSTPVKPVCVYIPCK